MSDNISSAELAEWQAWYSIQPWGEERADLRTAIVAATVAQAMSDGSRRYKLEDFMAVKPARQPQADPLGGLARRLMAIKGSYGDHR